MPYAPVNEKCRELGCNNLKTSRSTFCNIHGGAKTEKEFINESLKCNLLGMNSKDMSLYIEYVADGLLNMFNYPKYYNSENPFNWMDMISAPNKTNFFLSLRLLERFDQKKLLSIAFFQSLLNIFDLNLKNPSCQIFQPHFFIF